MTETLKQTSEVVREYLELFELQNTILEMVAAEASQQEILDRLCQLQERMVSDSVASIMIYDSRKRQLRLLSAPSLDGEAKREIDGLHPSPGAGSCANVILKKTPQFVSEIAKDDRWAESIAFARKYRLKACWSVPVLIDDEVVGTFAISSFRERKPTPFHRKLLSTGARIVSIVLKRERQHRRLREQDDRVALLANVFENIGEGIVIADRDNRIIEVNEAFEKITGYGEKRVKGEMPLFFADVESRETLMREIMAAISSRGVWRGELKIRRVDGGESFEWVVVSRLKGPRSTMEGFLYVISDINELKLSQEKLSYLAFHDPLTGLVNRTMLMDRIEHIIDRAERVKVSAAVLFLDLDRFKYVNDTFGHAAGDLLLVEMAKRLQRVLRKGDTIARFGGDEFVILLEDIEDRSYVYEKAQNLLSLLKEPIELQNHSLIVYGSIGIAVFPDDGQDAQTLLKHADTAMYQAKQSREHIRFYTPQMSEHTLKSLVLEKELSDALEREEFRVYYQPIVRGGDGGLDGAEALVRWEHPERGLIFPGEFIPFAEETGLIARIDEWVLERVIADLRQWHADPGNRIVPVSVNISGRQINRQDVTRLIEILNRSALARDYIGLEVTETYLMQFVDETVTQLERLKHAGVKLSMDDFGSGYSSLGYLKRFKIDTLKIDQLLVHDIVDDRDDRSIADAIIKMGHSLGLRIIAEGVETKEQYETLRQFGCDAMQGFYFDRALPRETFEEKYLRRMR